MKIETRLKILKGKYNFVPLIDVIFLLLIFFMLSSSFVQVSAINVQLPSVTGEPTSAEKLVITIDKYDNYYFNDQVMDLKTLKEQLAVLSSKYQVDSIIIRADKATPQGAVAKVLAMATSLNLNVYFAVGSVKNNVHQVPFEKE
ncbi:MAG TPA: biopolymer transporter ExbD [Victivallales bacterium]|nr:biopolymer transporter ExbD [Victivallales bacterium]